MMPHDFPIPATYLHDVECLCVACCAQQAVETRAEKIVRLQRRIVKCTPADMLRFCTSSCPQVYVEDYEWEIVLLAVSKCDRRTWNGWVQRLRLRNASGAVERLEAAMGGKPDPLVG